MPKKALFGFYMTACAVFALLFAGWARDYVSGLVLYLFTALSMGGNYTTGLIILADRYPIEKRGRAFSVLGIGGLVACLAAIYYGRMRKDSLHFHFLKI